MATTKIRSSSIEDGQVANADLSATVAVTGGQIADDAVTLAKMAGLARGKIIVGDSSGDPSALTVGGASTVLTSDGTDAAWTAPAAGGSNAPYFYAYLVTDASISDATWTKVPCNTVSFETGATYDETTNFRFTPAVAGKYYIYGQVQCRSDTTAKLSETRISIYKNGSDAFHTVTMNRDRDGLTYNTPTIAGVLDMNTTDYVELWAYIDAYSGGQRFYGSYQATHFMAYKLID